MSCLWSPKLWKRNGETERRKQKGQQEKKKRRARDKKFFLSISSFATVPKTTPSWYAGKDLRQKLWRERKASSSLRLRLSHTHAYTLLLLRCARCLTFLGNERSCHAMPCHAILFTGARSADGLRGCHPDAEGAYSSCPGTGGRAQEGGGACQGRSYPISSAGTQRGRRSWACCCECAWMPPPTLVFLRRFWLHLRPVTVQQIDGAVPPNFTRRGLAQPSGVREAGVRGVQHHGTVDSSLVWADCCPTSTPHSTCLLLFGKGRLSRAEGKNRGGKESGLDLVFQRAGRDLKRDGWRVALMEESTFSV